jgi:DNA-binding GntR family transcriptional regulator
MTTQLHSMPTLLMLIDLGNRRREAELICNVDAHRASVARVCAGDPVGARAAMSMHFDLSGASMPKTQRGESPSNTNATPSGEDARGGSNP